MTGATLSVARIERRSAGSDLVTRSTAWRISLAVASAACFLLAFLFRYLSYDFNNDDYVPIAKALQILHGELPFRDFTDPGFFLQIFTTAALQSWFGHNLLSEALVAIFFISLSAALVCYLVGLATGSVALGLLMAVLQFQTYPRFYNYPKVFPYVLALWMFWRYARRPTPLNGVLVALSVLVAFFYRHDHGVYVAFGAFVLLVAMHWRERRLPASVGAFMATGALVMMPFLLYLQLNGGVFEYLRQAREFVHGVEKFESTFTRPGFVVEPGRQLVELTPRLPVSYPVTLAWVDGISPDTRLEAEKRLELRNARQGEGGRFDYDLVDTSEPLLRAILAEPLIRAVQGIDATQIRATGTPREGPAVWLQRRLPILRMSILPGVLTLQNAMAWLYWSFVALVPVASLQLFLCARRGDSSGAPTAWVVALALMCAVLQQGLLRLPLEDRVADVAAPTMVLGGWVLGQWLGSRRWQPRWKDGLTFAGRLAVAAFAIVLTWTSVATFSPFSMMTTPDGLRAAIGRGPAGLATQTRGITTTLATTPALDAWDVPGSVGLRPLTRWLNTCIRPSDHVFATWFAPEVYYYSDRPFGAGQVFLMPGLWTEPIDQEIMIERMKGQSLPVVIAEMTHYENIRLGIPDVDRYIGGQYRVAKEDPFGDPDYRYRIWVNRDLAPTGTYERLGLPCFT
jgi:hypothetical protein